LKARGVPTSVVHQRIDRNRILGGIRAGLDGQEQFDSAQIAIPVHAGLTDADVELVIEAIAAGW
jgi:hypothetical protein